MNRPLARNRGSILVLALMISAAAAIAGMWMVLTADLRVRANRYLTRASDAARFALSGIELSRIRLGANVAWAGDAYTLGAVGSASGNVTIATSPVTAYRVHVQSTGTQGDSTQSVVAELKAPSKQVLDFNVVSSGAIEFEDAVLGGHLRANGNVKVTGDVDFSGTLETKTGASVSDRFPSSQVAYSDITLAAPTLSLSTLQGFCSSLVGVPEDANHKTFLLDTFRLTPSYNPWGNANASGAYVLNAEKKDVSIKNGFVRGMLLILDAKTVTVEGGYSHWRQDAALPTLVVQGDLDLRLEAILSEAAMLTDLNGDGDVVDLFEPRVDGVVQATGSATLPYGGTISGCVLGDTVKLIGFATVLACAQLQTQPVHQYTETGAWEIVAGSMGEAP